MEEEPLLTASWLTDRRKERARDRCVALAGLCSPRCFAPPAWATPSAAQASVDGESVRGHHRALVGGEIENGVRDLLRGRMAPERDEPIEDLGGLVARPARCAHLDVILERGRCRPRMQRVDPD